MVPTIDSSGNETHELTPNMIKFFNKLLALKKKVAQRIKNGSYTDDDNVIYSDTALLCEIHHDLNGIINIPTQEDLNA